MNIFDIDTIITEECKEKIKKLKREELFDFEYTFKYYDTLVDIIKKYENIKENKRKSRTPEQDLPYKILFDYLNNDYLNKRKFNIFWFDDKFDKKEFDKLDLTDEEKQRFTELQIQQIKKNIYIIDFYKDCINEQIEKNAIPKIQDKIKSYIKQKTAKNTNTRNIPSGIPSGIPSDIPSGITTNKKNKRNTRRNARKNARKNEAAEKLKKIKKFFRSRKVRTVNPLNPFSKRYTLTPKQNKDFEAFFNPYLFAKSI
jgi:hypothetical protein